MENNPMKRLLAMVLTICMLVTMVPTGVFATDADVSYADEESYVDENPYVEDQDSNVEEDPYVDEEPYVDEDSYAEAQEPYGVAPMSLGTSTLAVDTTENTNVSPVAWNGDTLELYVGSQADSVDVAYESLNNIVKSKISVPKGGTWRVYEVETDKEIWYSFGQSSLVNSPCTFKVGYTYQLRNYNFRSELESTYPIVVSFFDLLTIENNVEDGQVWKVFRGEPDNGNYTLTVADKSDEGYTSVEVKQGDEVIEPTEAGGNTYTIQMNGDTTVSVVYSSNTSIPICNNSADHITFGGAENVQPGKWGDVTITPHEGYYIKSIEVSGDQSNHTVSWTDGAATVRIVASSEPGENPLIGVCATAAPVLSLKDPEENPEGDRVINYHSGMTYDEIVKEIMKWVVMDDTVAGNMSIGVEFKTLSGWNTLTVQNIGSEANQFGFIKSRTIRVRYYGQDSCYPSGVSQEFEVKLVDPRPTLEMSLNQATLYLGGVKSMNWEDGKQKFEYHPSSYDKADVLAAMGVAVKKADGTSLELDQSKLEVSIKGGLFVAIPYEQITATGTYNVTVTYKDENYKDGQVSQSTTLTVVDGTPNVEITLIDTTIQWNDRSTWLTAGEVTSLMKLSIRVIPKGTTSDQYWLEGTGYTVSIEPKSQGARVETAIDGTPEVKEAGTYLVTVTFDKEGYGKTTKSATLTVNDARKVTRVSVCDSVVPYTVYEAWTDDNWNAQLHNTIHIQVTEGENTAVADPWSRISVYTVAEDGTETELTQKPGAGTYKLRVKYAGDNTRKPSQADATLTIEKAPGTTEVTVGVTNASYSSTIGAAENKISVPYGSCVNITFTADEGYYLPGTYFANEEEKVLAANGMITIQATNIDGENVTLSLAAVAKNAATITAADSKVLEATDLSKIEELVANTSMIQLFGAEVSNVFAGDTTEITYEVNGRNGVTQVGTYNVVFSYAGDDHTKAATKTVSLTIQDARPTAKLTVKDELSIPYDGNTITQSDIIAKVFDVANSDVALSDLTLAAQGATGVYKISKYVKVGSAEFYTPSCNQIEWKNNISSVEGKYKVTLSFAGNDQYKANTVDAYFTVTDNRPIPVITAESKTILISNTDELTSVDNAKLISWANAQISATDLIPSVSTIYKESNGIEGLQNGITELFSGDALVAKIDSEGIYYVTFTFSGNAQYKAAQNVTVTLDIRDVRPTPSVNLKEGVAIPCKDSSKPITKEQAFNEIFQNVTVPGGDTSSDVQILVPKEGAFSGNQISVKMTDMAGKEVTQATASEDTYYLEVTFLETNIYKPATAKVAFSVTDGREAVTFATDKTEIPYDFANGLKADAVLAALGIQVKKQSGETMEAEIAITLCDSKKKPITNADFDFAVGSYYAYVEYAGDTTYAPKKEYIPFSVVDARLEPVLTLKQGQSVDYKNGGYTANELYALVFDSLAYEGESVAHTLGTDLTITMDKMNGVGTYTVTVSFAGNNEYKPVTDTVEIEVVKAPVSVTVTGTVKNYSEIAATGYNVKNMITVEPEDCDVITFAAGLYLGDNASTDNGTLIHVDLPSIIDWDKFDEYVGSLPIGGDAIQKAVAAIREELEKGYDDMTIQELSQKLTELLEALKAIENIPGVNLNTQSIDQLIKLLNQIQQIEGVGTIKVRLTMGKGINITDSGAYLVGAVSSDANYKTDFGLNYLLVLPNAQKAELAWNVEDENGIYTLDPIKNGTRDMGAHVESVQEGSVEEAQQHVVTFFLGLDSEGKPTIINDQKELNFGVYTEIAYICNLGNTMYYAKPIARLVTIVADVVEVKFDDGNSKTVTFNGEPQAMPAKVYTRDGQLIEGAKVNYRYIGMEADVEVYNSTQAPTHVGVYTVTATYSNENKNQFGLAVGTLTITPAEASVTVTGKTEYYQDGTSYPVTNMIENTPDDAKMTVVTAYIADMADFSENGFAAVEGNVNIDFPDRIDQLLKITPDTTYTVADFKQLVKTAVEAIQNAGLDSQGLDQILELVNALPEQATLTFKDHNSIAFSNVGVYLVAAAVTDSDYTFVMDQDLLIIAPKTTEVTLQWNVEDKNGIITMEALKTRDMGATAYDEDGEKAGEDVQAKVVTYYLGLDKDGNTVVTDNKDDLTYGAWTQVAYVKDFGADMHYAAPIMRAFVIAPQEADVNANVEPNEVTYDGKPHSVKVTVDGKEVTENLTVKYNGSTTLPVDAGTYVVTAVYKETDENGNVTRYGSDVGTLVIKPADPDYKIEKTEVCPGKSYTIQTNKIPSMTEILVIDDGKGNVYIQLPGAWADKLPADWDKDVNVTYWVDALKAQLDKLPQEITDSDILVKLVEVLDQIQVKTITVNELPTAEGTYTVSGVVAGKNYLTDTAENVLIIGHKFDETWEADENKHWHECQRENCDAKKDEAAHKDENPKDHKCDTCEEPMGECVDTNKDHECDYGCNKPFGTCQDTNKDHKCDYGCKKPFGTCEDTNKDHKCDYGCDKPFGTCEDTNKDHKCDYGCGKTFGTCEDTNKDHKCDYGCNKPFGTCEDTNKDHKCDYGCGKTLSDHKAKTENAKEATCTEAGYTGDEFCSICGEPMKTGQTIAALDHDWDQGTVTKAPTYSETGIKIYTCKRNSSHTREEVLKALCDKTRENCPIGPFHDAETNCWYHDGVHYCIENGLMIGFPDGTFRPGDAKDETSYATRAQVVTILWRLAGSPVVEQDLVFTDVDEGAWYMPALRWAVKNNVVEGYPENTFRPNDLVTRQAVAALFCRYFNGKMDAPVTGAVRNSGLRDYAELHPWAEGYMDWAYENGLFVGFEDNTLRPTEGTTRAQLATLLFRYLTR